MILPTKEFWLIFKSTHGALSTSEAIAIMQISSMAPEGIYLCLGSHKGKDSMAAAVSLKKGIFYLVDPIFEDDELGYSVCDTVEKQSPSNLEARFIPSYSTDVIASPDLNVNYSYVFVDSGSHQDGLPMMEVKLLEDRVVQGGIIAFHDFRSQFVEVEQAYNYLLGTGKYEEIKIDWDAIVNYVRENDLEKGNNSWHHNELDFPCFVGALKRK